MQSLAALLIGLVQTSESRGSRASCALNPRNSSGARPSYLVVFANPHGGGDTVCRLLQRHPELNCTSLDLFNPSASGPAASERKRVGFDLQAQRAKPGAFLQKYFEACTARVCGVLLLRDQLPQPVLPQLFAPGCDVSKLIIERNATQEYAALKFARRARPGRVADNATAGSNIPPWRQFLTRHSGWLDRAESIGPRARWYRLQLESLGSHSSGGAQAERELLSMYQLLDVRPEDYVCIFDRCKTPELAAAPGYREVRELTNGYEWAGQRLSRVLPAVRARRSVVGSPTAIATSGSRAPMLVVPQGGRAAERQRRRQATIGFAAAGSFSVILVGGFCLALGIAIGQRIAAGG
jgi:hypothetical protein